MRLHLKAQSSSRANATHVLTCANAARLGGPIAARPLRTTEALHLHGEHRDDIGVGWLWEEGAGAALE